MKQRPYDERAERVRTILNRLSVRVEHLPREVYGPNLHIEGMEKAVRMIMDEFGYQKPDTAPPDR